MELKDTLNLPKTAFPMRGNLVQREPERLQHWQKIDLYAQIQKKRAGQPAFVLHDGPPFTNGDVHIGTALNKILKDMILRYKSMRGFSTPYIPGWDCHGLPIEHKVTRDLRQKGETLDTLRLRKACADFSAKYIELQRSQFTRLGVLADWQQEYRTMDPAYEAEILRTFALFVEKGLVYRSKKPVYWSIPCQTALAEAEIEYQDHKSPSVWVRFDFDQGPDGAAADSALVIWTTTPWTLPANQAIAVHPQLSYVEVLHGGRSLIVAHELADRFIADCGLEGAQIGKAWQGRQLEGLKTRHPFINRPSPVVLADYVTTDSGTGCVHTAPGHGLEDYHTGLAYKLDIYCPLDDNGCYLDDGQITQSLVGVSVLEKGGKCPANEAVLDLLRQQNALLADKSYLHQYPHCWRSKTPVIFRAMDQWFVSLDANDLRKQALQAVEQVRWTPEAGIKRIQGALQNRPDWCISRQRTWGVPIPAFFTEDGRAMLDAGVIRAIADKVEKEGSDIWFAKDAVELLQDCPVPAEFNGQTMHKGMDTLDVWIDSGCSHRAVLRQRPGLHWPADLYLEGSDQHRGWFQSSLWTAMVADGSPPYRHIVTHGFIVDEQRRKISKSAGGKPQTADMYVSRHGADIIRLWLSSEDYRNDIPISETLLKQVSNTYRSIRNTLMFQLGNLHDFDWEADACEPGSLDPLDQWALARTDAFLQEITAAYERFEFHRVYQAVDRFCGVTLSRIYHDILKDRLYTHGRNWPSRRSSQTAIHLIFNALNGALAPILPFTADEAHSFRNSSGEYATGSIHTEDWPEIDSKWYDPTVAGEIEELIGWRDPINEKLELLRQQKTIGKSLDAKVILKADSNHASMRLFSKHAERLAELFIVSQVELEEDKSKEVGIEVAHADGVRCPRSWRWVEKLVDAGPFGQVSARDCEALASFVGEESGLRLSEKQKITPIKY